MDHVGCACRHRAMHGPRVADGALVFRCESGVASVRRWVSVVWLALHGTSHRGWYFSSRSLVHCGPSQSGHGAAHPPIL